MNRSWHLGLGILFWASLLVFAVVWVRGDRAQGTAAASRLDRYWDQPRSQFSIPDTSGLVRTGDPVFRQADEGHWHQIGYVIDQQGKADESRVEIVWYDSQWNPQDCQITAFRNSGSFAEVAETMFPPEKRIQIQKRLAAAMQQHGAELTEALMPLVQRSLQSSIPLVEAELRRSVERHRDEIDELASRWNHEVVHQRLIPLARKEIMPIVRRHGEPIANEIGHELWDRASLWRFGWRAVYDKAPLPQRNLVQGEWQRFVQEEAIPVIDARMNDIVAAVQRTLADTAANPRVRSELSDVASEMASNPRARYLVRTLLKESIVENERLRFAWTQIWTSDEARRVMDLVGRRLEPVLRSIGDDLLGTQDEGIDPNFARVLRNQILGKDRRWLVATLSTAESSHSIQLSGRIMAFPVVHLANPDSVPGGRIE